jgi:cytochrome b561
MASRDLRRVKTFDAIKTYRYLRIGMIAAVVLLAASIAVEILKAGCLQTSISAYYYTPVRAVFVGAMFIVGSSLIIYKGRTPSEDLWLNLAGMLAPVVAVVPTSDVGTCRSVAPIASDTVPDWVIASSRNNLWALWITGVVALVVAVVVWRLTKDSPSHRDEVDPSTGRQLLFMAVLLAFVLLAILRAQGFIQSHAHGLAAIVFFLFLFCAIVANVRQHRGDAERRWRRWYVGVAAAMAVVSLIGPLKLFRPFQIFVLEAVEIVLFATYWIIQTVENWDEKVIAGSDEEDYLEMAA